MALRMVINGFGRIGCKVLRSAIDDNELEIVAINDLTDTRTLAHLLKYDSVHGTFPGSVKSENGHLIVNGKSIRTLDIKNPEDMPWSAEKVDIVLEATGKFTKRDK